MNLETRLAVLEKIYALHAAFCGTHGLACGQGCAVCCTANVTLTTLEASNILHHWQGSGRCAPTDGLAAAAVQPRFQPALTINRMAALYLRGKPVPEEAADPGVGSCPLLANERCTVYPARPMACRAMVSRAACVRGGAADMPEEILSANHLLMQFIEALDPAGVSGNLADVLLLLLRPGHLETYASGLRFTPPPHLAHHHPIPALMIPPELRGCLLPLAQAVQNYIRDTQG